MLRLALNFISTLFRMLKRIEAYRQIALGNTRLTLDSMLEPVFDGEERDLSDAEINAIALSSQFYFVDNQHSMREISNQEYDIAIARITHSLLHLINRNPSLLT